MSFQQGLSGLNATSKNLEVIGNNVANANTYGAKASRAEFSDMYASAINGAGTNSIGIGVKLDAVAQQFTQGNIVTTDNPMDLAINGGGFFQLSDGNTRVFSRNGQFKVDKDGWIVNNQQQRLLGYDVNDLGQIQEGPATELKMRTQGIDPKPSTKLTMELNLDSRALATEPAAAPKIDFTKPATYNNATSLTVFDDKGQEVPLTFYFQKATPTVANPGGNLWNVYATAAGTSIAKDASGNPIPVGTLGFDSKGGTPTLSGMPPLTIPGWTNAVTGENRSAITLAEFDVSNATQYGAAFAVTDLSQDGNASGQLTGIQIESDGIITARYSNGKTQTAGQVETATFRNPQGLQPIGGNAWAATNASGQRIPGKPGSGNLGLLQSGALEESNVDLTAELVNMITAQRVYQANAQTIKTQDQVLQTLVNLR